MFIKTANNENDTNIIKNLFKQINNINSMDENTYRNLFDIIDTLMSNSYLIQRMQIE